LYKIETSQLLRKVMKNYFQKLSKSPKVAWCTSVGPAELLRSFGFEIYFPENHGALLGATRTATDFIPEAVKCGFSGHICSYTTSDIGSFITNKTPLQNHYGLEGVPKPDLLVYNTNQCREVEDWFTWYADYFKCPIVGIQPPRYLDEVTKDEVDLVVKQMKKIIPVCEKVSGSKFDIDKFRETIKLSKEATSLWQEVLKTGTNQPSPINFFDGTIHMGPIVVLRGLQSAIDYYEKLLKELNDNVEREIGFLEKDGPRLFWEGMPIWGKLRMMSDLFAQNNATVVASTYCNSWIFEDFDEKDPFESSALAYTKIFINRSERAKMDMLKLWFKEYSIDGIVYHDTKTCFNNSNAKFGMPQRLTEQTGIPSLVIEGDLCDLRFFSEDQSITKIETFIEQIEDVKVLN